MLALNTLMANEVDQLCEVSLNIAQDGLENRITCMPYWLEFWPVEMVVVLIIFFLLLSLVFRVVLL